MNKMKVCQIARHRVNIDGTGIRTLIVVKNCELNCKFCINPKALNVGTGYKEFTARDLYEEIIIDKPYFIATNGGITFGGGEPLLYACEIARFAKMVNKEFSIYLETSLNVELEQVYFVDKCIDKYYIDIKTMNPEIYRSYTGGSLERVLNNLEHLLNRVNVDDVIVRIPVIPGYTTEADQNESMKQLMKMGVTKFDLFTYQVQ